MIAEIILTSRRIFGTSRSVATTCPSTSQPNLQQHILPHIQQPEKQSTLRYNCPEFVPKLVTSGSQGCAVQSPEVPSILLSEAPQVRPLVDLLGSEGDVQHEEDLADIEGIWQHVLHSDDEAAQPSPCKCHGLSLGTCPEFCARVVEQIRVCRTFTVPNMDGARIPLVDPSFDSEVWRKAMGSYFDSQELVAAIKYGWDIDLVGDPHPKDAERNNASAKRFPEHVSHYVEKELSFASLIGPFDIKDLPFRIFRSPFGLSLIHI